MSRLLHILLLVILSLSKAEGQNYPIQVTPVVNQQRGGSNLQWSSFFTTDWFKVRLVHKDKDAGPVKLFLRLKIERPGVLIRTREDYLPATTIDMSFGFNAIVDLTGNTLPLKDYFRPENLTIDGIPDNFLYQGGTLPDGFYMVSVTAYEYDAARGYRQISNTGISAFAVFKGLPPIIQFPKNNQVFPEVAVQNTLFQWLPRSASSPHILGGQVYKVELFVADHGVDPREVANSGGTALFTGYTKSTSLPYGPGYPGFVPLIPGKQYALRVTVESVDGNQSYYNEGRSEVVAFTYGTYCSPPAQVVLNVSSELEDKLTWLHTEAAESYTVLFTSGQSTDSVVVYTNSFDNYNPGRSRAYRYQIKSNCSAGRQSSPVDASSSLKSARSANPLNPDPPTPPRPGLSSVLNPLDELVNSDHSPGDIEDFFETIKNPNPDITQPCGAAKVEDISCEPSGVFYNGTEIFQPQVRKYMYINGHEILITGPNEGLLYMPFINSRVPVEWSDITVMKGPPGTTYGCITYGQVAMQGSQTGAIGRDLHRQVLALMNREPGSFSGTLREATDKMARTATDIKNLLTAGQSVPDAKYTDLQGAIGAVKDGVAKWKEKLQAVVGQDLSQVLGQELADKFTTLENTLNEGQACSEAKNCTPEQLAALIEAKEKIEQLEKEVEEIYRNLLVPIPPLVEIGGGQSAGFADNKGVSAKQARMAADSGPKQFLLPGGGTMTLAAGVDFRTDPNDGQWIINGDKVVHVADKYSGEYKGMYKAAYLSSSPPNPCTESTKRKIEYSDGSYFKTCEEGYLIPDGIFEIDFDKIITVAPDLAGVDVNKFSSLFGDGGLKAKFFLTNDATDPAFIAKVQAFQAPDGWAKIWLHQGPGGWELREGAGGVMGTVQSSISAFVGSMPTSECNGKPDLSAAGLVQSIKDGDADNLLYGLHKGLKFLSQNIEKAQIPQEYWNCTDAKYNGTMAKVLNYMIGPVISPFVRVIDGKLGEIYPSGDVGASELTVAAACGIWNGMIGTFSGAINAINTLVAAGSCKGREDIWDKIEEIKNFQSPGCLQTPQANCETGLTAFLKEMGTTLAGQPCVMAEMGGQVAFGVGLAVFTGGASSTISGGTVFSTFVKTLKFADRVTEMFDIGGRVFSMGLQMAGQTIKFSMRGGKAIFKRVDVSGLHTKTNVNGTDGINYTAYSDQNLSTAGNRVDPLRDADGSVIKNDDGLAIGCLSAGGTVWNYTATAPPVYYASADNTPAQRFEQANYTYAANGRCKNGVEVFLREAGDLDWFEHVKRMLREKGIAPENHPDFFTDFDELMLKKFVPSHANCSSCTGTLNPEAWLNMKSRPNIRKDQDALQNMSELLGTSAINKAKLADFANNSGSLKRHLEYAVKLKDKQGFNHVLADIAAGGNNKQGAEFVLEYAGGQSDTWIGTITAFEKYDVDIVGGNRRYDIQSTVGNETINLELKHWYSAWNTTTFRTQFLKDLSGMDNLGKIKWIFKKTDTVTPDIGTLKERVLNSLGTFNTTTNKWVAGNELKGVFSSVGVKEKLESVFGTVLENADDLLDAINLDSNFKTIFDVL